MSSESCRLEREPLLQLMPPNGGMIGLAAAATTRGILLYARIHFQSPSSSTFQLLTGHIKQDRTG